MDLIYLVVDEYHPENETGVSKKIDQKVVTFGRLGANVKLLFVTIDYSNTNTLSNVYDLNRKHLQVGVSHLFKSRLNKIKIDRHIYRALAVVLEKENFDKIIFRYPGASHGLLDLVKQFPGRIVFEHNTIEEAEFRLEDKKWAHVRFSLYPSKFLYWLQERKLKVLNERIFASSVLKYALGGICVTGEIEAHERRKYRKYSTLVTGNGYQFNIPPHPQEFRSGDQLNIGYVISKKQPWVGLDRIVESLPATSANVNVRLFVVGIDEDQGIPHPLVSYLGQLNQDGLNQFYRTIHVVFGPMALYRKGLVVASALKIKESIAHGIPFVVGYKEQFISDNPDYDGCYLEVENNTTKLDFKRIYNFALDFYKNSESKLNLWQKGKRDFSFEVIMLKILQSIAKWSHAV